MDQDLRDRLRLDSMMCLVDASQVFAAFTETRQITETRGSPSATISIDGKQHLPPDPKFGGVIKDSACDSKSWWPPTIVPADGSLGLSSTVKSTVTW